MTRVLLAVLLLILFPHPAFAVTGLTLVGGFLATYGGTILTVASLATSIALAFIGPKGQNTEGPRLGDTRVQTSTYGTAIPKAFGRVRMAGNVIWVEGNKLKEIRRRESVGGKGGAGKLTTYEYFFSGAIVFAEADPQATAFTRLWSNKKLIFDRTGDSEQPSKYPDVEFRFYNGTTTQNPDPLIEAEKGVGLTSAYRGLIYLVVENLPVKDFGNGIPSIEAEIQFATPPATVTETLTPQNNYTMRDLVLDRSGYNAFGVRRTDAIGTDGQATMVRMDLLDGSIVAETGVNPFANEKGVGANGFRPKVIMPGPDGKVLAIGINASNGAKHLVELNPFTLQMTKHFIIESLMSASGSSYQENAVITWTQQTSAGAEVMTLVPTTGEAGGLPDVDGNDLLLIHRRLLEDGSTTAGLQLVNLPKDRDLTGGSIRMAASVADKDGVVWLVGQHQGLNTNSFGNRATLWRFKAIQDLTPGTGMGMGGIAFAPQVTEISLVDLEPRLEAPRLVVYDKGSHSLIIFGAPDQTDNLPRIVRYDISSGTIVTVRTLANTLDEVPKTGTAFEFEAQESEMSRYYQEGFTGGTGTFVYKDRGDTWREMTPETLLTDTFVANVPAGTSRKFLYHPDASSVWQWSDAGDAVDPTKFSRFTITPVPDDLDEVLKQQLRDVRLDPDVFASFDAGVQAAKIQGYIQSTQSSGRDTIEPLLFVHPTMVVESDGILKFTSRGAASARTISEEDLGAGPNRPTSDLVLTTRLQEVELPERVTVRYLDVERDYQENSEFADRHRFPNPTQQAGNSVTQNLPMVLDANVAFSAAESNLFDSWAARKGYEFRLGPKHMDLDPGDIVTLELSSSQGDTEIRLASAELAEAFVTKMEGGINDSNVFTVADPGISNPTPSQAILVPGPTEPLLLDLPLLRDIDSGGDFNSGIYIGFGAQRSGWTNGAISKSLVGNSGPFEDFETSRGPTAWGFLAEDIDPVPSIINTLNRTVQYADELSGVVDPPSLPSITISMVEGTSSLSSKTHDLVMAGANTFVIIAPSTTTLCSEVWQFLDVLDNGDGTVTLSKLSRGRRGTEEIGEHDGHQSGAMVVFLDESVTTRKALPLDDINTPRFYRALSLGEPFETAVIRTLTLQAQDLKPYPVDQIVASVAAGASRTGDVTLTWTRRTRLGAEQEFNAGVTEPGLGEESEEYEVDLLTPALAVSITKTTTSDSVGVTFTSAERATAGYAAGDLFNVDLYQMSETVGRGRRRRVEI